MGERTENLFAGALLCTVLLCYALSCIGCLSPRADTTQTWTPVTTGRWVLVPPDRSFVIVEVKLGVADDRHYMRISTVALPRPDPTPRTDQQFAMVTSRGGGSQIDSAGNPGKWIDKYLAINPKRTVQQTVPWICADGDSWNRAYWTHVCCDCLATHLVVETPTREGLGMMWWKDKTETRKKRRLRGLDTTPDWADRWSADQQ